VPEKFKRYRLVAIFVIFSLPATALAVTAWFLSISTPFFKSPGQILLVLIGVGALLILSSNLFITYTKHNYLKPLDTIIFLFQSLISRTYKPLPNQAYLGEFKPLYLMLNQIQSSLDVNNSNYSTLNQTTAAQNKLFDATVFETTDPIIILNQKFEIKFVNLAVENFTGIKKMDSVGKRIDQFVRFYDKNNNEIPPAIYGPVIKDNPARKIFTHPEVKIVRSVNMQSFADITVLQPEMGEVVDVSCVILLQDKTKEKQLEAMKLDFVSMAAHELRTPLTSIKGYISVFIKENEKILSPDQMMFITRINTSTQQLAGLVENLLSVSRVERGAMSLHTQIVDWVANVKSQAETFEHRADEKRISFKFITPTTKIPQVQVDLVRINEVLNNMISNALSYTEPMGKIEISITADNDLVCTHIKDTGKGIPKEALAKLFSKFFRVQGGPAEQASKGNGLGLYLSKAIVELHKGKIWAESEGVNKGSTFSFCLPAVADSVDLGVLTKHV